jgi:hypothetical protein
MYSDMVGFYLKFDKNLFQEPEKVFGNLKKRVEHVVTRYDSSDKSLGVLLTGNKGSGKSLFTAIVANKFIKEKNLPVILINEKYTGPKLNDFINTIGECVIMFDEFGKVYGHQEQSKLLTMFDGLMSTKRMILVTENETRMINEFIINRPGRFMYHFKYTKLDEETVEEYCDYMGVPEKIKREIHLLRKTTTEFSMDTLSAIVSEYKLFGGDFKELISILNISTNKSSVYKLSLVKYVDDETKEEFTPLTRQEFSIPDLTNFGIYVDLNGSSNVKEVGDSNEVLSSDDDDDDDEVYLNESHIKFHDKNNLILVRDNITFLFNINIDMNDDLQRFISML